MARYTTLSSAQLAQVVAHYTIGTPKRLTEIAGGFGNSNFRLTTTTGDFLLKICDEKNRAELDTQIAVLQPLQHPRFPTAYPVLTRDRHAIVHEDFGSVMLFPFLPGEPPPPTQETLAVIGEALALMHRIPPLAGLPPFSMGVSQMRPFLKEVRGTPIATHPFVTTLESELERLTPVLSTPLRKGIIHGDLFLDNTLFEGDKLVAILDFEEVCHDALILDVAMTLIGCCYTSEHELNRQAAHRFLETYNRFCPLRDTDWELLHPYIHYAALSIAFWRFRQYNVRHPDPERAESYQEMLTRSERWTLANTDKPIKAEICL